MKRRILAALLVLAMVFGMIPAAFAAEDAPVNLALDATVTASSTTPANNYKYSADKLNNGDSTSADDRWAAASLANTQFPIELVFEWKENVVLDTVKIFEWVKGRDRTGKFHLAVSQDGEIWNTVYEGEGLAMPTTVTLEQAVITKFLKVSLDSLKAGITETPTLSEIEVYRVGDAPLFEGNLALYAEAAASTEHSATYGASKLNDGDLSNRWAAKDNVPFPLELTYQWPVAVAFDTVKIYEWSQGGHRTGTFHLAISQDGETWTTVYEGGKLATPLNVVLDKAVTAKYLMVSLDTLAAGMDAKSQMPTLTEIEVFNNAGDASIHSFAINGANAVIDGNNITFTVEPTVDLTALEPVITVAPGATVSPVGPQNFTAPVVYTVIAKDGKTTRQYTVTAQVQGYLTDTDLVDNQVQDVDAFGPVPTPNQYDYHKDGLSAFLHFSMNTFTGKEWGDGKESPSEITLTTKIEADHYVKTLKDAGFTKLIYTGKHHDGFCMWDSAYTEHDIAATNYPGDVLEDLSAACTKYDMDMGLYLSPWDENAPAYGYIDANGNPTTPENDVLDYNDYYDNQLREILGNKKYGNNGRFVEVWMDGAKGSGAFAQEYDFERWLHTIQELQGKEAGYEDDVLLFGTGIYRTVRWIGNENGIANEEDWAKATATFDDEGNIIGLDIGKNDTGVKHGNQWIVPEADARITSGWFWGESKKTPKSLAELKNMYLKSVGYNAVLLLNVPLNDKGTLDTAIENRLLEFGKNCRDSFETNNLLERDGVTISADTVKDNDVKFAPSHVADGLDETYWAAPDGTKNARLLLTFDNQITFDGLSLEEAIQYGQRIESFSISYKSSSGEWLEYANGTTIGAKRLVLGKPVKTNQIRITFQGMTSKDGEVAAPVISHVGVYKVSEGFQLGSAAPDGIDEIDSAAVNFQTDDWTTVTNRDAINGSYLSGTADKDALTISFTGTRAWLVGSAVGGTKFTVSVDGGAAKTVTLEQGASLGDILMETEDLSDGPHTLEIQVLAGTLNVDAIYVLNNGGVGLLDFEAAEYTVDEDMRFEVKVLRKGGSKGKLEAILQDNPGTAVQSSYYTTEGIRLTFEDGETEKTVTIRTKRYEEETGKLFFTLELVPAEENGKLVCGFNEPAKIWIRDAESYTGDYLQELHVVKAPDKTVYQAGETLDTTGMVVEGVYQCEPEFTEIYVGREIGKERVIKLDEPVTTDNLRLSLESILNNLEKPCIHEIEVYNGSDTTNLARSAKASAIASHSDKYGAAKVNDGNKTGDNRWTVPGSTALPLWVRLDWDKPVTFDTIKIYEWRNNNEKSYRTDAFSLDYASGSGSTVTRVLSEDQYTVSPSGALETVGENTITVTSVFGNKSDTFTVTVEGEVHTHAYDQKNTDAKFQKSPATCTEPAVYYFSCQCGEKGTETFTSGTALGHDYKDVVTAPTCEDKGCTTHTCSRCNHSYVDGEVAALGHDYKDEVTAPTCTEKGCTTHTCSRCGHSYVDTYVEAKGHTEVIDEAVVPTCCETGLTEGKHCSVCDEVIVAQVVLPKDPDNHVGEKVIHDQMDPTTEHDGYTGDVYCGACGKLIEKGEIIPKLPTDPEEPEKPENPFIPNRPNKPVKPVGPTAPEFPFTDVHENDWFYEEVKSAWENDLVDGVSATKYAPNETLTVASAIKLAAALHQMDNDGYVSLKNGAPVWYSTYVDYAVENGVIEESYLQYTAAQMNAPVTRAEFIHIFYGAMDNYDEINDVKDGHIPDVKMTDKYADEIYTFYRAGILTGCDSKGSCRPATVITRGEVAAILIRMYDVTARVNITL